jgi:outer membrane protein assembly factor BamA
VTIVFAVDKGKRDKVAELAVRGNRQFSAKHLLASIPLEEAHWFSRGHFSQKALSQSVENLTAFYRAAGFEDVSMQPQVTNRESKTTVTLAINEGPRTIVNSLEVKGNQNVTTPQLAPAGLRLQSGHPYSQQRLNEDRNEIVAKYLDLGYLTAQIDAPVQPHGGDPHSVDVVYDIHEGPCTRVSSVVDLGAQHTKLSFINQSLAIQTGDPLSQGKMLESDSRLYKFGVFDWASIEPQRPITNQEEEDVLVRVHEGKRNRLSYGIGFEAARKGGNVPGGTVVLPGGIPVGFPARFQTSETTILGPRFSLDYSRLNMRGRGETASIGALFSRLDQRGLITYSDPRFLGSPWSSLLSFSAERSTENPIFTERTGEGSLQGQRLLNADETKTLLFRYSYGRTVLTDLLIPELVLPADRNVRLSTLSAAYVRDTRDKPLDAHRGIYQTVDLGLTSEALGSSVSFVRFPGQMAYYRPVWKSLVWANDVRLGFVRAFAGSTVPLSQRFFSGGANSLRGFPINGAGP